MKKMKLLPPILILLCAGMFVGYQAWCRAQADNKAPEITITEESIRLSTSDPRSALLQGITAQDNRDGDVTDSMVVESIRALDSEGNVEVTFAAFDQAGNVSKGIRTACYTDYKAPRFSLSQAMVYSYGSNFDPLNAIDATDPLDGEIRHRIRATSLDGSAVSELGEHEVEFRVTNSLGDTVRLILPITVYPANNYGISLELRDYLIYLKRGSTFDAEDYLVSFTHNRETYPTDEEYPKEYNIDIDGTVNSAAAGVYPVEYTVTYTRETQNSIEQTTGFTRLIVVVED